MCWQRSPLDLFEQTHAARALAGMREVRSRIDAMVDKAAGKRTERDILEGRHEAKPGSHTDSQLVLSPV